MTKSYVTALWFKRENEQEKPTSGVLNGSRPSCRVTPVYQSKIVGEVKLHGSKLNLLLLEFSVDM